MNVEAPVRLCPFCGAPAPEARCAGCGQDVAASRRPCAHCHKMTPARGPCMHCRAPAGNDLSWKIPLIIGLFVLAFIASVLLHSLR